MPSRRDVLLGSGAITLAGAVPLPIAASGPAGAQARTGAGAQNGGGAVPSGQVPSAYRYRIGDAVATVLNDGVNPVPLRDGFVTNAELADVAAALEAEFLPPDTITLSFNPLLVRMDGETILVDTGYGDNGPPTAGRLRANMEAAGAAPEDVTRILITHFHPDHISGIRNAAGALAFPNARILVPEPEWAFWMDASNMEAAPEGMRGNFELVRRIFAETDDRRDHFAWEEEVLPGITSIDAKGHTPGHTAFMVASGDARLLLLGDTANHPALFVRHPDWALAFDMDADEARRTRHRLLDRAAEERLQIAGFHFPFPATGHVAKDGDGYDFVPIEWSPIL